MDLDDRTKYIKVMKTLLEMLKDRGDNILAKIIELNKRLLHPAIWLREHWVKYKWRVYWEN